VDNKKAGVSASFFYAFTPNTRVCKMFFLRTLADIYKK